MSITTERPLFSQNLIRIRKQRGLSQRELAEKSGVTHRMIAYYEKEAVKPPIDKIEPIAKALGVSISDLLGTKETTKIQDEFAQLDTRTLKKLKMILSLTNQERHMIYTMAESLIKKREEK
jgi:transcriptional regulator with XRE-family HTH domain